MKLLKKCQMWIYRLLLGSCFSAFTVSIGYAQTAYKRSATAAVAACQPFKGRSLTVVVPFRAGGGFDLDARALKPFLERHSQMDVSVVNMPGASGLLAARAVADATPNRHVVGILDPRLIAGAPFEGLEGPELASFAVLGSLGSTGGVWLATRAIDWNLVKTKRFSVVAVGGSLARLVLAGQALGMSVESVSGYQSTQEAWLGAQRGEIDFLVAGKDSAERYIASTPGATISFILGSASDPEYPGVPYLAGPGGLADRFSKSEPTAERSKRMTLASLAALGSPTTRMILASTKMPMTAQRCLTAAIEASLFDPERVASAHALASNSVPQTAKEADQYIKLLQATLTANRELVLAAVKSQSSRR